MGGKSSSAPKPQPTLQVDTPSIDVAQVAAEKALAAQGNVRASTSSEDDKRKQLGATQQQPQAPKRDAASVANTPTGNMSTSAVLTG